MQFTRLIFALLFVLIVAFPAHATGYCASISDDEIKFTKTIERIWLVCGLKKGVKEGKYDEVNTDFNLKNVPDSPCKDGERIEITLFHFTFSGGRYITTEQVLNTMKEEGCEPVNWPGLLALGVHRANLQTRKTHVALANKVQYTDVDSSGFPALSSERIKDEDTGIWSTLRTLGLLDDRHWSSDEKDNPWVFPATCS